MGTKWHFKTKNLHPDEHFCSVSETIYCMSILTGMKTHITWSFVYSGHVCAGINRKQTVYFWNHTKTVFKWKRAQLVATWKLPSNVMCLKTKMYKCGHSLYPSDSPALSLLKQIRFCIKMLKTIISTIVLVIINKLRWLSAVTLHSGSPAFAVSTTFVLDFSLMWRLMLLETEQFFFFLFFFFLKKKALLLNTGRSAWHKTTNFP